MTETAASDAARALAGFRKREQKICAFCGKTFEGIRQAKYCSQACAVHAYWKAHRQELNANRRKRYQDQKAGG